MAVFNLGDNVETIDDIIQGTVTDINRTTITICTADDFMMDFEASELVIVKDDISVSKHEVAQIIKEKEASRRKNMQTVKPKERSLPKMEVDLHIHQLVKNYKGMENYQILNLQTETAKRQLEFAMSKRIQKVVFIHGVGEGVLKEELRYLFSTYDNVRQYEADYQKYGLGATEVYITQQQ